MGTPLIVLIAVEPFRPRSVAVVLTRHGYRGAAALPSDRGDPEPIVA